MRWLRKAASHTKIETNRARDPERYVEVGEQPAFIYPITATLKPFLAKKGHSAEEVETMHEAWLKSVILQVTLWSQPYVHDGDF